MPNRRFAVLCLVLALLPASMQRVAAQPPETADPPEAAVSTEPNVDQLHDELRAVRAAMERALNERDLGALVENVTSDVVFTTMNGDVVRGAEQIRDYYAQMMQGEDRVVESVTVSFIPDALSILYDGDTAIAFGATDDHYELADGRAFDVAARWTATLLRRDGRWRIAAFHYSTDMFDNPVLATQRRVLIGIAAGAALVAFLVAFLLGRAVGRRRRTG